MKSQLLLCAVALALIACDQNTQIKCSEGCEQFGAVCDTARDVCVKTDGDLGDASVIDLRDVDVAAPPDLLEVDFLPPPDLLPMCITAAMCTTAEQPICGTDGNCRECNGTDDDAICQSKSAAAPKCKLSGTNVGHCVACEPGGATNSENATCASSAPVCTEGGSCRKCAIHSECASTICNANGTCEPEGNIVYVNNGAGACTGTTHAGTQIDPYCEINDGIANRGTKTTIRIVGSATEYKVISISAPSATDLRIVGPGSTAAMKATVREPTVATVTINVTGALNVTMEGLVFGSSSTATLERGVDCKGSAVSLTLRDVIVQKAGKEGVFSDSCVLTISATSISGNVGTGVSVAGGSVSLSATTIHGNAKGIDIGTALYVIENNLIAQNTQTGVSFTSTEDPASTSRFWFNTVALNGAATTRGGINCGTPTSGMRPLGQSIIAFNTQNTGGGTTQIAGDCTLTEVVVGTSDMTALAGAIKQDPSLVNNAPGASSSADTLRAALKLSASDTSCADQVDAVAGQPLSDLFGTMRPQGSKLDIGAHERSP